LKTIHNADLSRVPPEEFESALVYKTRELERERAEHIVRSKGRIIAAIDASPVFETDTYDESFVSRLRSLPERLGKIREQSFSVRHTVQTDVYEKTTMTLSGRAWTRGSFDPDDAFAQMRTAVMGTVRHQYSPRLQFEATTNLLRASNLDIKVTHSDENSTAHCEVSLSRALFQAFALSSSARNSAIPPVNISYSRRLFRDSPTEGTIMFSTSSSLPIISVGLSSARLYDFRPEASIPPAILTEGVDARPPSNSGLSVLASFWNTQVQLAGVMSGVSSEWGVLLAEVGVRIKVGLQLGLAGLNWSLGGEWRKGDASLGSSIALGLQGVILKLE